MADRVKLEMAFCFYYWVNPDCELDENIVAALWKFSTRLRRWYTKYNRRQDEIADIIRVERMIGAYDEYIRTQVSSKQNYFH